jgi:hypothetical protein
VILVIRRLCALAVGAILSGFACLLLTGQYLEDGPVLISLSQDHGLHAGDLFVIAGWAVGIAALVAMTRTPSRSS